MSTVLGLDLSTRTGWAVFHEDELPLCGTERLPKVFDPDDYGKRTVHLWHWLGGMIDRFKPTLIAMEAPFIPRLRTNTSLVTTEQVLRLQISLACVIELVAGLHKIECTEVSAITAKKTLTGNGRAEKAEMVIEASRRGWRVADDHQSDACAVAMVAMLARDIWRLEE